MKEFYVKVGENNPELSELVQKKLFELGYKWDLNGVNVTHRKASVLTCGSDKLILYGENIPDDGEVSIPELLAMKKGPKFKYYNLTRGGENVEYINEEFKVGCRTINRSNMKKFAEEVLKFINELT